VTRLARRGTQERSLDAGDRGLSAENVETCVLVVESSWSVFIVSTGHVLLGCSLSYSVTDWLHRWVCMGVPSLDGCVPKLSLHVLAGGDVIAS
jgi:hypothetical protein